MDINIRQVQPADLDASFWVESECFLPSEAASRDRIQQRIQTFPRGFLVAELDSQIVGHVNSGALDHDDITDEDFKALIGHKEDGDNIVIFSLAVLPQYQGVGIGQRLMEKFSEAAIAMQKQKILLLCKADLISYYEKIGFKSRGLSQSRHGGFEWFEMEKKL